MTEVVAEVEGAGAGAAPTSVLLVEGQAVGVRLELAAIGSIRLDVRSAAGAPAVGVEWEIAIEERGELETLARARCDDGGRVEFPGLDRGREYLLVAFGADGRPIAACRTRPSREVCAVRYP